METKHQCHNNSRAFSLSLSPFAALCFLRLHILASRSLSCSPSWRAGFIHQRGYVLWRQRCFVCVCVVVCQVLCACVGWSVVSLLAMRHSSRHTCTHRGGGCCVRGEGAVGDLCELDLGFLVFTSQSGCYSIVVRESRNTIDRWGGGSKVKASLWVLHSLFPPWACSVSFICFLVRWNKSFSLHYVSSITRVGGCSFWIFHTFRTEHSWSRDLVTLSIPKAHIALGQNLFRFAAANDWNLP